MPPDVTNWVGSAQTIIVITVGIVWLNLLYKTWTGKSRDYISFWWGLCILILSIWRTASWVDDKTIDIITPENNWVLTVIIWTLVSAQCLGVFFWWWREHEKKEE